MPSKGKTVLTDEEVETLEGTIERLDDVDEFVNQWVFGDTGCSVVGAELQVNLRKIINKYS